MSLMRVYDKLRAQVLTQTTVTWDTAYSTLLEREDFRPATGVTASTDISITYPLADYTLVGTTDFILPRTYAYRMRLDGYARGNLNWGMSLHNGPSGSTDVWGYPVVSLVTKTSAGTVTSLGSATLNTRYLSSGTPSETKTETSDVPFWIQLQNKLISETNLLLLRIQWYSKSSTNGAPVLHFTYNTALNTDDIYVTLPLVPASGAG